MSQSKEVIKTEARIQAECFEWFHNEYQHLRGLLYHVPNGEKRSQITAGKLKAMGVVAGIPDIVFHYRSKTFFFEFKKPKSGRASEAQKKIHKQLDLQRFQVWMPEDLETFQHLIKGIVNDKREQFAQGLTKDDHYYRHKIFDYLYTIGNDEVIKIDDVCELDSKDKFMHFVTEFIVEKFGRLDGFEVLFTSDFSGFYKTEYDGNE